MDVPLWGAGAFGAVIGWNVYFVNRHRSANVQLSDLTTLVGIIGGGAVLALFPAGTGLFGAYGVGLALGFFFYFLVLLVLVQASPDFDMGWFLDGRRKEPAPGVKVPAGSPEPGRAMEDVEG